MPIVNRIAAFHDEMRAWRRDLHAHPETAFEEKRTSDVVAAKLAAFGLEVHRGLARTGVVGTLRAGGSARAIGLRADMDALHIEERNGFAHCSTHRGKMHACGHDGHTTMLLGAAKYLAETRNFDGTIHFIFQPAEENEAGGRAMVADGLFEKFPVDGVYGMHNWPGMPAGEFGVRAGPMMAAADRFEIAVAGSGAHAAMPHKGVDPVLAAAQIVVALQSIASRAVSPIESAVVSVTQVVAGHTFNVIPDDAILRGTTRSFKPDVQALIEAQMRRIVASTAAAYGAAATLDYRRGYPPTVNSARETELAAEALVDVVGAAHVHRDIQPTMGAEDFAFMLEARPGCYVFIGNGDDGAGLHHPRYDFNDEILPVGASYWARLAERLLPR